MTPSPKILIVGGVAGGASAATRARRLNEQARIIMLEKDGYVSFANCGMPYYIGGEIADRSKLVVASAQLLRTRFRIDVRERSEAVSVDRAARTVRVRRLVDGSEYKRRQAPPGVKITARAFGRDRRYPITNGFTGLVT